MVKKTNVSKKKTTKSKDSKFKTKTKIKLPKISLNPKRLIKVFVVIGLLFFVASGFMWFRHEQNDVENVFWAAIENNLRSVGATRHIEQSEGTLSSNQYIQFSTSVPHLAQGVSEIKQDTRPPISISTESVGTPYKDFVRYTKAETSQTRPDGQVEDFSSILNIWGVSGTEIDSGQTGGQLYADSILNIVPSANLSYPQRKEVMNLMRSGVYTFVPTSVVQRIDDSRPVYSYTVQVDFEKYIRALRLVAGYVGLSQLDTVEPEAYAGRPPVPIDITVDVWSRMITGLAVGGRSESFVSRGVVPNLEVPSETIPLQDLQERINVIDQEQ